jgi:hypothetical protein
MSIIGVNNSIPQGLDLEKKEKMIIPMIINKIPANGNPIVIQTGLSSLAETEGAAEILTTLLGLGV